jgi:hypothetical protein
VQEAKRLDAGENRVKQHEVHANAIFNRAMVRANYKYEYPFLGKDEKYTHSFLLQEDPYDSTKDERLRAKWIEEARQLFGEFKP